MRKLFAFTLAEVLITLAIIGIVAALTIPTLVANYQKKQYVSGLQKGISTLSQTFKMMLAQEGVDYLSQTSIFKAISPDSKPSVMIGDNSQFVSELGKYMKIVDSCHNPSEYDPEEGCKNVTYTNINGDDSDGWYKQTGRVKVYTSDGYVYYFRLNSSSEDNILGRIEIDINGDKAPNIFGRDTFSVLLLNDGQIIFPGSKYWKDEWEISSHWSDPEIIDACSSSAYNDYCAARVFEQGWKMDY